MPPVPFIQAAFFMRKFEISDRFTTADIGLNLEADSLEELFAAGADGLYAIIFGEKPVREISVQKKIDLKAGTPEQLLVDWLSELLYLFDTDGLVANDYRLTVTPGSGEFNLGGKIKYFEFHRETDAAEHEVKAVTYYKLGIKREGGLYRCHVVFDL